MDPAIYKINKILIDTVYQLICVLYPVTGTSRDFARFYVLETVARVPYFAYLSVLHLRETFGERYPTMSDKMRTHYAQADNELHHLLIMEDLGGNDRVVDRWIAQSTAFVYFCTSLLFLHGTKLRLTI
jgi:ubiquinol oxidase